MAKKLKFKFFLIVLAIVMTVTKQAIIIACLFYIISHQRPFPIGMRKWILSNTLL